MWSYTAEESAWLSDKARVRAAPTASEITPEMVAYYVAKGRTLRARYLRRLARRLSAAVKDWTTGRRKAAGSDEPATRLIHELRTPLTSIRSFSEILRDHPNLPDIQRARYLDIILSESQRLELVISSHEAAAAPQALR